jgi:D-glycero-alpha-D-manno-heptose-7-phosphate kinase
MTRLVTARACCRVDLAGGTLDIWPLGLLHPGARTVNVAIDVRVVATLERLPSVYRVRSGETRVEAGSAAALASHPEGALVGLIAEVLGLPPVEVRLESASPRGAGLGASSALAVAMVAAGERLLGRPARAAAELAALARDIEARLMGLPTGTQDHYPALLGGALEILHLPGGERVRRLAVDLEALAESLLVVYSQTSHFSAASNWQVVRRRLDGDPEARALFAGIAEVASEIVELLEAGDFAGAGGALAREWSFRRLLAAEVSTPALESLLRLAGDFGAWGGKACGAGGGGCLVLLCPPERRAVIAQRLSAAGGAIVPARPTTDGLEISASEAREATEPGG